MKPTVTFRTTPYVFAHGRQPRGRGSWAFARPNDGPEDLFWHNGTYAEAKTAAKAHFQAKYPTAVMLTIEVCS